MDRGHADNDALEKLMLEFESLGDNCEFGLVQRKAGAEPLGLMRFTSSSRAKLMEAVRNGFEDIEDIEVRDDPSGEIVTTVRRYGFINHTFILSAQTGADLARPTLIRRHRYLRTRLLEQLAVGDKILVRKDNSPDPDTGMAELYQLLRGYGPNHLLWVVEADADHPPGSVEQIEEGLFRGHIGRLAPYDATHLFQFDTWVQLCRTTLTLARGMEPAPLAPAPATSNFAPTWRCDLTELPAHPSADASDDDPTAAFLRAFSFSRASPGTYLDATGHMQTAPAEQPRCDHDPAGRKLGLLVERAASNLLPEADGFGASFTPCDGAITHPEELVPPLRQEATVMRHILLQDFNSVAYHHHIATGLTSGDAYCMSCWVWIPNNFQGNLVAAGFSGFPRLDGVAANLTLRRQWQRIWCTAYVPPGITGADPALYLAGGPGDTIYTSCWQLEAGTLPTSYIPTHGAPAARAPDLVRCEGEALSWLTASRPAALVWEGSCPSFLHLSAPILRLHGQSGDEAQTATLAVSGSFGPLWQVGGQDHPFPAPFPPRPGRAFQAVAVVGAGMVGSATTPDAAFESIPWPDGVEITSLELLPGHATHHAALRCLPAAR